MPRGGLEGALRLNRKSKWESYKRSVAAAVKKLAVGTDEGGVRLLRRSAPYSEVAQTVKTEGGHRVWQRYISQGGTLGSASNKESRGGSSRRCCRLGSCTYTGVQVTVMGEYEILNSFTVKW